MKVPTKVFLPADTIRKLDEAARRTRRQKSEIARAAIESYLSPDASEAAEAAMARRLDRMSRQLDRLERDQVITTEAVGLFVKTWLKVTPAMSSAEDRAAAAKGQERYAAFVDLLGRRLSEGKLLRREVLGDMDEQLWLLGDLRKVRFRAVAMTPSAEDRAWLAADIVRSQLSEAKLAVALYNRLASSPSPLAYDAAGQHGVLGF